METPLEAAVRSHFGRRYEPMVGQSRHTTPEIVARVMEQKTAETVAILRETIRDDEVATDADLFRAEIEANHRRMRGMVERMRDPERLARFGDDPRKSQLVRTLADNAERAMAIFGTFTADITEEQLAKATEELKGHWTGLTSKIEDGPPAPQ